MQNIGTKTTKLLALVAILTGCGAQTETVASNFAPDLPGESVTLPPPQAQCVLPEEGWCSKSAYWEFANGGCTMKQPFNGIKLVISKPIPIESITHVSCSILEQGGKDDWEFAPFDTDPILNALYQNYVSLAFMNLPELHRPERKIWFRYAQDLYRHHALDASAVQAVYGEYTQPGIDLNPLQPDFHYLMCFRFESI